MNNIVSTAFKDIAALIKVVAEDCKLQAAIEQAAEMALSALERLLLAAHERNIDLRSSISLATTKAIFGLEKRLELGDFCTLVSTAVTPQ